MLEKLGRVGMFEVQQGRSDDTGGEARQTPSRPKQVWVRSPLERGTEAGGWVARIFAGGLVGLAIAVPSQMASAHQTQISDGVGGTHHIEPNDTPRAGELSQTWFALTQAGGTAIGLSDCDCELQLLGAGGDVIASPVLSAIAVEGLTDVPAAELTFPQVGAYVLALSGEPKTGATFSPFSLEFPVTVAAGVASAPNADAVPGAEESVGQEGKAFAEAELEAKSKQESGDRVGGADWMLLGLVAGGVSLAAVAVLLKRRKQQ